MIIFSFDARYPGNPCGYLRKTYIDKTSL